MGEGGGACQNNLRLTCKNQILMLPSKRTRTGTPSRSAPPPHTHTHTTTTTTNTEHQDEMSPNVTRRKSLLLICVCSLHTDLCARLSYSILGCVLPLQEAALCQSPPTFSVLCYPCPYRFLFPHNVISPTAFWSSN